MQVNTTFLIFFFILESTLSCAKDWIYLEGFCYKFSSQSLPWAAAQAACEDMGSTLAVVDSKEKQNAIAANLKGQVHRIGLYRDPEDKSRWLWVDWSRLCNGCGYWFSGEPNNSGGKEDCGEMWPSKSGLWNDAPCSLSRRYICQKRGLFNFFVNKRVIRFNLKYDCENCFFVNGGKGQLYC